MPQHGVGLRTHHFPQWLELPKRVGLVEAITENFADRGGRPLAVLERIRRDTPVALHGVSLSVGGTDALDVEGLARLDRLARRIDAAWVGDHLSFGTVDGRHEHDLWPVPFTEEALCHVVERIGAAQDILGRRLVIENVLSYIEWKDSEMTEWAFLCEVAQRSDCELLLDLNNVYVNATNQGFDPYVYVDAMPTPRIRQLHLAGHDVNDGWLFDSHAHPVAEPVWQLFRHCVRTHGPVPVIIEWDDDAPSLERVIAESQRAQSMEAEVLAEQPGAA
jgi:uncharacterized protein